MSLYSVTIDNKEINLRYFVDLEDARKVFAKKDVSEQYLIDEIYQRTLKMHTEKIYCLRFLRPHIDIEKIRVQIEVDFNEDGVISNFEKIKYTLMIKGYPSSYYNCISEICPELRRTTGAMIASKIHSMLEDGADD